MNEAGKVYLSRHDVWTGLMMKAQNALPYVPQMQKCEVIEEGDGWLLRDIIFNNTALRERVTFEPEARVIFDRVGGPELGRIENIIGEDEHGNLTLTFAFGLTKDGIAENTDAERAHFAPMEGAYMGAVAATLGAVRRTVVEQGRDKMTPASPDDVSGDNKWVYDFFKVADSLQMEPFLQMFADDVQLTFANDGRLFYLLKRGLVRQNGKLQKSQIAEVRYPSGTSLGMSVLGMGQGGDGEIYVLANTTAAPTGATGVIVKITEP